MHKNGKNYKISIEKYSGLENKIYCLIL